VGGDTLDAAAAVGDLVVVSFSRRVVQAGRVDDTFLAALDLG